MVLRTLYRNGPKGLFKEIGAICTPPDIPRSFEDVRNSHANITLLKQPYPHTASVDIIVCVHNALEDTSNCLSSILTHTTAPYKLILIDDGSEPPTADLLKRFSQEHHALLIRNEIAQRYTKAANQGLHAATGQFAILLNSDTIVSAGWLDRLIACAESDATIGLVGPLSNTASWQSIPEYEIDGDWASNPLPTSTSLATMAEVVARYSSKLYPRMPFLNGFCLLIRTDVVKDIGYFDDINFPLGYGEENDYCLRARKAGWSLALADDVYVYHAQSKSYNHERRKVLSTYGSNALLRLHDSKTISEGVEYCRNSPILNGIRAHSRHLLEREADRLQGELYRNKRIAFILPVDDVGGGANIVLLEAAAMLSMGIDVYIVNLKRNYEKFQKRYIGQNVPVIYVSNLRELHKFSDEFDAIIATANYSVKALKPFIRNTLVLGYYIQDFEPYFYKQHSPEFDIALKSYSEIENMVLFTKTEWNRTEIMRHTKKEAVVIGPSANVDLFVPRPRSHTRNTPTPLRICAMVRPNSERRNPMLTMNVLSTIAQQFTTESIEISIFGVSPDDPDYIALPRDFPHQNLGILSPQEVADLLNDCDIFADFSVYQAMGLTALEAMAMGGAVIVPMAGGANSFAEHNYNSLVVDTSSIKECTEAVARLIKYPSLRNSIQKNGIKTAAKYFPERTSLNILKALWPSHS